MKKKTAKPTVNRETFNWNVVQHAQELGKRPIVNKNDLVFPENELQTIQSLHERVLSLIEQFKIGASVFDNEARPVDLNLVLNWDHFIMTDLVQRSQHYTARSFYYARAFHEVIGIAVAVSDAFLGLMDAPSTMDFAPNMQVRGVDGKGKPITWIARVKTTAEAYHHARMECTAQAFLKKLKTVDIDAPELGDEHHRQIHEFMMEALGVMSAAVCVSKIYSDKKWVVCKD